MHPHFLLNLDPRIHIHFLPNPNQTISNEKLSNFFSDSLSALAREAPNVFLMVEFHHVARLASNQI
jgi:hypothetical protein